MGDADRTQRQIDRYQKKLREIDLLLLKQKNGTKLEDNELQKIKRRPKLLRKLDEVRQDQEDEKHEEKESNVTAALNDVSFNKDCHGNPANEKLFGCGDGLDEWSKVQYKPPPNGQEKSLLI